MRRGSGMEYKIFREPLLFSSARVKRDVLISALEDVFFFCRLKRRVGEGSADEASPVGRTVGRQQCVWHRVDAELLPGRLSVT